MLLLTKSDVVKTVTMQAAIDIVEKAFMAFSKGRTDIPIRTQVSVPAENAVALYMPGFVNDLASLGIKIVTVFPKNPALDLPTIASLVVLNDTKTGEPIAAIEGSHLTAIRTGAASGVATRHLARRDAVIAAIIGAGIQAKTQLEAVLCERNIQQVNVFDIDPERAKQYVEEMQGILKRPELNFQVAESADDAVNGADIICTTTTSKKPVFSGSKVKEGAHINAVGAFTPEMQEIGEDTLVRANKVVVDSVHATLNEAGDLVIPVKKGLFKEEDIYGEIGEISSGKKKGRENSTEITLFKTVGLAAQDMAMGMYIFKRSKELGLGKEFDFLG